jgi:homoserine O-acetyltransferase
MNAFEFDIHLPPFRLESSLELRELILRGWWSEPGNGLHPVPAVMQARVAPRTSERERVVARTDAEPVACDTVVSTPARPTILVVHALTGDMRAGGPGGWWEPVIGPGRPLDSERYRILCFNNLGSCYGSSSPDDRHFPSPGSEKGDSSTNALPAPVSTWDQARSILLALDTLGIGVVDLLVGGSVGGMITLCLAALAPDRFKRVMPVAASVSASPWIVGFNHIARQCVLGMPGTRGLEVARQLAHMTYRAEPGLIERQGRTTTAPDGVDIQAPYRVQTYLDYQGSKIVSRYTPSAYLAQLGAMDSHDLERKPGWTDGPWAGDEGWGVARLRGDFLCTGINTDALYLPDQMRTLTVALRNAGAHAEYAEIRSPHGHDAFLIEWDQLGDLLRRAINEPVRQSATPRSPG